MDEKEISPYKTIYNGKKPQAQYRSFESVALDK